jgi:hypothetical protein
MFSSKYEGMTASVVSMKGSVCSMKIRVPLCIMRD